MVMRNVDLIEMSRDMTVQAIADYFNVSKATVEREKREQREAIKNPPKPGIAYVGEWTKLKETELFQRLMKAN